MAEAGYPDFKLGTYFVLLAPAGLPDAIAELLEREVREVLASPELEEKFRPQDIEVIGSNAAEARAFLRDDTALWARIAKEANLQGGLKRGATMIANKALTHVSFTVP